MVRTCHRRVEKVNSCRIVKIPGRVSGLTASSTSHKRTNMELPGILFLRKLTRKAVQRQDAAGAPDAGGQDNSRLVDFGRWRSGLDGGQPDPIFSGKTADEVLQLLTLARGQLVELNAVSIEGQGIQGKIRFGIMRLQNPAWQIRQKRFLVSLQDVEP
jgi:hypothetical protein